MEHRTNRDSDREWMDAYNEAIEKVAREAEELGLAPVEQETPEEPTGDAAEEEIMAIVKTMV
ncbi:MAG: hypothetical protein J5382_04625 [Bacteroidales bacterium]|nr:hypothetical protein [Bacteroidales bacterium]